MLRIIKRPAAVALAHQMNPCPRIKGNPKINEWLYDLDDAFSIILFSQTLHHRSLFPDFHHILVSYARVDKRKMGNKWEGTIETGVGFIQND